MKMHFFNKVMAKRLLNACKRGRRMLDEGEVFYDAEEIQEFWLDKEDFSTQYLILPVVDLDVLVWDRGGRPKSGGKGSYHKSKFIDEHEDIIPEVPESEIE